VLDQRLDRHNDGLVHLIRYHSTYAALGHTTRHLAHANHPPAPRGAPARAGSS
jgi:hypothetical protein